MSGLAWRGDPDDQGGRVTILDGQVKVWCDGATYVRGAEIPEGQRAAAAQAIAGDEYVVVKRGDIALWEVLDRDGYRWDTSATEDRAREQADRIGGTAIPLYRKAGL